MLGYCNKCFVNKEIVGCEHIVLRNGNKAFTGKCIVCGSPIIKKDKSKEDHKSNIWKSKEKKAKKEKKDTQKKIKEVMKKKIAKIKKEKIIKIRADKIKKEKGNCNGKKHL